MGGGAPAFFYPWEVFVLTVTLNRTEWGRQRGAYVREYMTAADPYLVDAGAADAPDWVRRDLSLSKWLAMPEQRRRERVKNDAYIVWDTAYPKPSPRPRRVPGCRVSDPEAERRVAQVRARLMPAPVEPEPAPVVSALRAFVLCYVCGDYVAARAGRPVVSAVGGRCLH